MTLNLNWNTQFKFRKQEKLVGLLIKLFQWKKTVYKTGESNGSNYVNILLRSNALLSFKNDDKECFIWSILASIHPCDKDHPNRVSKYREYFDELNIEGFDFTNGLKCSDVQEFEKLHNLSINILELKFYQDQNKWKHKIFPLESVKTIQIKLLTSYYSKKIIMLSLKS